MSISVAYVNASQKELGFVSDAETVADQLAELNAIDGESFMIDQCKERLRMTAPGISDYKIRQLDREENKILQMPPGADNTLFEGKPRYCPIRLVTFESIFS